MRVAMVSASFFGFFDAPPALGRYFTAAEDTPPNVTPVAVLAFAFWQTRYGGRNDVLGSTLQIGPTVYTIVGVAPEGFFGLWPTQRSEEHTSELQSPDTISYAVFCLKK